VLLEACTANGNTLNGLRVQNMSDVAVIGVGGTFNNNGSSGVWANVGSLVWFNNWAGPVDVNLRNTRQHHNHKQRHIWC
jgi:hypothetical protein